MLCNNLVTHRGVEIKQSADQGSIAQRGFTIANIVPYNRRPILAQRDLKSTSLTIQYYFIINSQIFLQIKRRITNPA